tara:strand:- start:3040 stop:3990 length:951 start_codon:yes stop_codon:yes gene_type:complete
MIFLATNKRDITIDFVVLELQKRGVPYLRLNTEDITEWQIEFPNGEPSHATFAHDNRSFCLSEFTAAYYRRPLTPEPQGRFDQPVRDYIVSEWSAILRSLWTALDSRWLNSPYAIQKAEDKPRQIAIARAAGLKVPETCVTNDFTAAQKFAAAQNIIAKPLRRALLEDPSGPGRVMFTSRVALNAKDQDSIRLAPMIFQQEIAKQYDVRVTVVDDRAMAAAIDSQKHEQTEVDWRKGSGVEVEHQKLDLPSDIATACIKVTQDLGLRYSAVDLIQDQDGQYWFLEANPNGQWAWIEQRTGHPITNAIVDALVGTRL